MNESLPEIDLEKCNGCGSCVDFCPTGAVKLEDGKMVVVRAEACSYCTECEYVCPTGAIRCPYEIVVGGERGAG